MALADNLTLNNSAATGIVFNLQSRANQASTRIKSGDDLASPTTLKIAHTSEGGKAGKPTIVRSTAVIRLPVLDVSNQTQAVQVSVVLTYPQATAVTTTMKKDALAYAKNLLSVSTFADDILGGLS
jgi:hypothetical protein